MDPSAPLVPPLRASLWAGVAAASVGVVAFWVFHTLWIVNVPAVLVEGVLWALAAGSAVGWAFHHLHVHARFPADWRGGLLFGVTMWLLLVPNEVVGLAFGPFTHLTRPVELVALAPSGLLGVPFAALLGWALTRRARSAVALAVATALAHFMLGGSLVYFGGRGVLLILFVGMLPTYLLAGLVLVRVRAALLARDAAADPPASLSSSAVDPKEVDP